MRLVGGLPFNRSNVLRTIRDGEARSIQDLLQLFIPPGCSRNTQALLRHRIHEFLAGFRDAGLIDDEPGGSLQPTPLIEKVQGALGLNLWALSKFGQQRVRFDPIFGRPHKGSSTDMFVLMPFGDNFMGIYRDHIKQVAAQMQLTVSRADDMFTTNSIVADIWSGIFNSRLIIADCTDRNPNVFYEIGVAHTVGRRTLLISRRVKDIPFDLRHI